ncbi:MAG: exosortase-associated EpsI family protein [Verrucomicrobiaceae bacterium]
MKPVWRSAILSGLVVATAVICTLSPEIRVGAEVGVIMQLPEQTGPYRMLDDANKKRNDADAVEKKFLPSDTEFAKAVYLTHPPLSRDRDVISCEIVLSGAERRSIHRPEVCLVGQGWSILSSATRSIAMGEGRGLSVRDLYIERNFAVADGKMKPLQAHFYYWFVGADVTTSSHATRIWLTLRDNILRSINHRWAYVTVLAFAGENFTATELTERPRSDAETTQMMDEFIRLIAPKFQKSLMDKQPVTAAN